MKAIELPFVESADYDGLVYLLFPGFDDNDYQGVQYEMYPEKGIVYVYGYEEGFDESGDAKGVGYPVAVPEEDMDVVSASRKVRVIDPRTVDPADFGSPEEHERVRRRFRRFEETESTD